MAPSPIPYPQSSPAYRASLPSSPWGAHNNLVRQVLVLHDHTSSHHTAMHHTVPQRIVLKKELIQNQKQVTTCLASFHPTSVPRFPILTSRKSTGYFGAPKLWTSHGAVIAISGSSNVRYNETDGYTLAIGASTSNRNVYNSGYVRYQMVPKFLLAHRIAIQI